MNTVDYNKLKEPLPAEALSPHASKTYLTTIKAIYVTERFNEVFGVGKWTTKVEKEYADYTSGMVVVKVTFEVPEHGIYYESFGGNDNGGKENNRNFDLGDAYKGATTDAITKIGSFLGIAMDVYKGLHDKPTSKQAENNLPWLNVVDHDKNRTKEWLNVVNAVEKGTITRMTDITKHYKLSKQTREKITKDLKIT